MNDDRTDEITQDEDVEGHRLFEGSDRLIAESERLGKGRNDDDEDVEGHRLIT